MQLFKKLRHPLPARLLHWTYVPTILASALSGFYISRPSRFRGFKSMDSARKTHFFAQYALLFSYLARAYYGYAAKNLGELFPGRKDIRALPKFLRYELFLTKKKPKFRKYNPGQKLIYTGFALLIPLQMITGFALYLADVFPKPVTLAGGLNPLRKLHYLNALSIVYLAAVHTYFVFTDNLKKLKSIFTGYE